MLRAIKKLLNKPMESRIKNKMYSYYMRSFHESGSNEQVLTSRCTKCNHVSNYKVRSTHYKEDIDRAFNYLNGHNCEFAFRMNALLSSAESKMARIQASRV